MVSLRFPFSSFPPPPSNPNSPSSSRYFYLALAGATAAAACRVALSISNKQNPVADYLLSHSSSPPWGSLSLSSDTASESAALVEPRTGVSFPRVIKESQTLLGIGLRRKSLLGLKNIDVYAFGVYADEDGVQKNLNEKYGKLSADDLKGNKDFTEDLLASDINLTVRLQIVYSRLSIKSVRSAFEESVGSRLQKFGGQSNKELLERFTSQFKDELKIPKGSVIEMSKESGHVLRTKIDGEEVGSIESKLLCQSVLDLYIGEDPFDPQAKENIMLKLVHDLEKKNAPVG